MAIFRTLILSLLAASLLLTGAARAQGSAPAAGNPPPLTAQELDSLLAPIALYPDSLLSQVLMASTYPLDVVAAARWVKANPDAKGDAALKKVENETWDVSVKSLAAFPSILDMMNEKLDWTQKLGDAFLDQQKDVLASVQRLRKLAQDNGNLQTNQQQVVRSEAQAIIIEPAQPQTVYVPSYNPTVVYGAWPYPAYPPYYYPPPPYYYPGGALATGFAWGVGIAAGAALIGGCNWRGGDIDIDVNRATNIDRSFNRSSSASGKWQHNAQNRGNVPYRGSASQQKFGGQQGQAQRSRDEFRGREGGERGGDRGSRDGAGGDRGGDRGGRDGAGGDRGGRDSAGGDRGGRDGAGGSQSGRGGAQTSDRSGRSSSGFDGVSSGSRDADRGRSSASGGDRSFGGSSGGRTAGASGGGDRSFGGGGGGGSRSFSGGGGGGSRGGGGGGGRGGGGRR
jgi:hypothetical protein